MSRDRDGHRDGFADAVKGVRPIGDRAKLRPEPGPAARSPAPGAALPRFVVEERAGDHFARRADVARRRLADLRAGRVEVDRELDLHGLTARAARKRLLATLERALAGGDRCVLVIHGAGRHSEAGAVLKAALPEWLLEGPLAREILAFATAPRSQGGPGASLVLLRRTR